MRLLISVLKKYNCTYKTVVIKKDHLADEIFEWNKIPNLNLVESFVQFILRE
jgi:hypothetical protein